MPLKSPLYTGVNLIGFIVIVAEGFFKIHKCIAVFAHGRCKTKAYVVPGTFIFVSFPKSAGSIAGRYRLVAQKFVQQICLNVNRAALAQILTNAEARTPN